MKSSSVEDGAPTVAASGTATSAQNLLVGAATADNEWPDDSPAAKAPNSPLVENYLRWFTESILHGDEVHRAWLLEALDCFIEGKHIPEPRTLTPIPQPTSGKQEQEWTVRQVGKSNLWELCCGTKIIVSSTHYSMMRLIADAHNASIEAEREKRDRIAMDSQSWGDMKLEWRDSDGRHYLYDKDGNLLWSGEPSYNIWRCVKLTKQLAAAQAANRKIYEVIAPCKELPAVGKMAEVLAKIDEICEQSDTKALDSYVAQECKPLVAALTDIRDALAIAKLTHWTETIKIIDRLLAQWKEKNK